MRDWIREISVISVWFTNVFLFLFVFYSELPEVGTSPAVPASQEIVNAPLPNVVELPLDPEDNHVVEVIPDSDVIIFEPFLPLPKKLTEKFQLSRHPWKQIQLLKKQFIFTFYF